MISTTPNIPKPSSPSRANVFLVYWLPALLWVAVIATFSSRVFAANNTGDILSQILALLHVQFTGEHFSLLHGLIRKTAHFTVYGTLSALFFRAWRGPLSLRHRRWRWNWSLLALTMTFLTASADEYHQLFTPGRTGLASDVLLDMCGATFAQLMIIAGTSRLRVRSNPAISARRG